MFETLIDFIADRESAGLFVIFLILLLCGLGLPIPEDVTIVASGILVSDQLTTFNKAFFVCMMGILAGDSIIFWLGRHFGRNLLKTRLLSKVFNEKFMSIGEGAFNRYGNKIIFFARFLPGLRAPIYFFAGTLKKNYLFFLMIDAVAALISVPIWIYIGKFFADNLEMLEKMVKRMQMGSIIVVLFIVILFLLGYLLKRKVIATVTKEKEQEIVLKKD